MKVFFKTFGCRTNIFDTQVMIENLQSHFLVNNEDEADIIVINSCTVTNGADRDVRDYISKVQKLNKKIFFTGCALDSVGKVAFDNKKIFGAFGHSSKENIESLLKMQNRFFIENDLSHKDSTIVSDFTNKIRGFIKVQEGCNFKCSYCIIPQVRGKSRSYDRNKILSQVQKLVDNGVSEVVLSGTNLGSYGKDNKDTLAQLIIAISKISGIKRIRLGSLEPSQIKDDFLEILDSGFLEKHLHIAIQHTNDMMLKAMNRINRFDKDLKLFEDIAKRGFAIGSDFIVGFPGESEEIFDDTIKKIKMLPLTHIHTFIYSPRNNTMAAGFKIDVSKGKAKERLHRIKDIVSSKNKVFRENKTPLDVLVENKKGDFYYGLDQFYNRIRIKSDKSLYFKWIVIDDYKVEQDMNYAEI